jgi:GxxExxY protein
VTENELSGILIGFAIEIHQSLGPGLPESSYKECSYFKIKSAGLLVEKEKHMPLDYNEVRLD